jgi:centromere/kinetochore protein ZW10
MTLFGQEIHVVERQIRDKLDSVEKELQDVVLEVQKQQAMIPEEEDEDMTEEISNALSQEQSVETLQVEAQELQVKIQFLKECSMARSLLDEATIVSSSGTAHDPDWVEAARMLQKAQSSLEQAEVIVRAEEERASPGEASKQALLGAYRIMDSIRVPMRRKRVELLAKATDLLNNSITVSEDSLSVQGSRLGSQADGINAAHDMLEALAPGDHSRWNDAVRQFADRLFQVVFEPQLEAHKTGAALTTPWKFEEISDTGNKGLSGRIAVTSSKKKGPSYTLEWTREHTSSPSSTVEEIIFSWGQTFAFVQRVMSFVEQRILLQRVDLCQYVGKHLFGARTNRPGNTINLAAFGLESNLIGDDTGSFMRPALRLLGETCIPSYLAPGELGRLKALSEKLISFVAPFEETLISKHFVARPGDKPLPLTDFSTHLEQKYVDQRRVSILNEARRILLDTDYHNTIEVGVDVSGAKDELLGDDDGMAVFQLHKSSISQTASKLMDLCRRTMDEAVESVIEDTTSPLALLPPNLYRGAREILDLFRAIIPATLGNEVATVPRTAAVLHNDCVFLAHHCLTLGLEYKDKFPPSSSEDDARGKVLRQTCIFVDMVPPFRELAQKSMGEMLERQQGQLWEVVGSRITFLGKSLRSNETVAEWTEAETAVKAGLYHLRHLSQAWRPILSHEVFVRSIAHLADVIFAMLVDQVLKAMAVSVPASQFVGALFNTTIRGV